MCTFCNSFGDDYVILLYLCISFDICKFCDSFDDDDLYDFVLMMVILKDIVDENNTNKKIGDVVDISRNTGQNSNDNDENNDSNSDDNDY